MGVGWLCNSGGGCLAVRVFQENAGSLLWVSVFLLLCQIGVA